jgi:hypothetical protein
MLQKKRGLQEIVSLFLFYHFLFRFNSLARCHIKTVCPNLRKTANCTLALLGKNHNTYYQVKISNLYDTNITEKETKKKVSEKFIKENIEDAIFERYPYKPILVLEVIGLFERRTCKRNM